jgi:catechol 2,3-dioxygenase-like lactoylglutathione lyase family enzyme
VAYVVDGQQRLTTLHAMLWCVLARVTEEPAALIPIGLDHILLNVSDPEKAAATYAQVLGPVVERATNRIWFQAGVSRIGLTQTPQGQRPGVNHFCLKAEKFDPAAAKKQLEQAGIKPEPTGTEFRDPDGSLIQVE